MTEFFTAENDIDELTEIQSGKVHLNAVQKTAISLVDKLMRSEQYQENASFVGAAYGIQHSNIGKEEDTDISGELAVLKRLSRPEHQPSNEVMLGAWHDDIAKDFLSGLPAVLTPEFKDHLKVLAEFDKAGKNATDEQKAAALEAYKGVGNKLKVALASTVISYGMRTFLKETKAAPFAGFAARMGAEPLAEMLVAASGSFQGLACNLINITLKAMHMKPLSYDSTNQDLFMAGLIGKFSDSILQEVERKDTLHHVASRHESYAQEEKITKHSITHGI